MVLGASASFYLSAPKEPDADAGGQPYGTHAHLRSGEWSLPPRPRSDQTFFLSLAPLFSRHCVVHLHLCSDPMERDVCADSLERFWPWHLALVRSGSAATGLERDCRKSLFDEGECPPLEGWLRGIRRRAVLGPERRCSARLQLSFIGLLIPHLPQVKLPAESDDWMKRPAYIRENDAGVSICENR